jgi:cyanate permease
MTNLRLGGVVPVLAHQGGWDEALMVAAPLAVIAVLLSIAKRRAERARAELDAAAREERSSEPVSPE